MAGGPWGRHQCKKAYCEAFRSACRKATRMRGIEKWPKDVQRAAKKAEKYLDELLELLHASHKSHRRGGVSEGCKEWESDYDDESPDGDGATDTDDGVEEAERERAEAGSPFEPHREDAEKVTPSVQASLDGDDIPQSPLHHSYDGKFIVCDHCRGHGLPCNEAPVCDRSQMSETPCVHRICTLSPYSKDDCSRPECRYVHLDYRPVSDDAYDINDYIILPGRVRNYLAGGYRRRLRFLGWAKQNVPAWDVVCKQRQMDTEQLIRDWVQDGMGTYEDARRSCGPECGGVESGVVRGLTRGRSRTAAGDPSTRLMTTSTAMARGAGEARSYRGMVEQRWKCVAVSERMMGFIMQSVGRPC